MDTIFKLSNVVGRKWRTDISALSVSLQTLYPAGSVEDDLILALHPYLLVTPSIVGGSIGCSRRAVVDQHPLVRNQPLLVQCAMTFLRGVSWI